MAAVTIHGWECDCVEYGHQPRWCPYRRPVTTQVYTDPDFRIARNQPGRSESPEIIIPPAQVRSRVATRDELCRPAGALLDRCWRAGVPAAVTYARGWTTRSVRTDPIGTGPVEGGKSQQRKTKDVAVRVESLALRCRHFVAVWCRRELGEPGSGWGKWEPPQAWVPGEAGGVVEVGVRQATAELRS